MKHQVAYVVGRRPIDETTAVATSPSVARRQRPQITSRLDLFMAVLKEDGEIMRIQHTAEHGTKGRLGSFGSRKSTWASVCLVPSDHATAK